jgi:hypothetical protein
MILRKGEKVSERKNKMQKMKRVSVIKWAKRFLIFSYAQMMLIFDQKRKIF